MEFNKLYGELFLNKGEIQLINGVIQVIYLYSMNDDL